MAVFVVAALLSCVFLLLFWWLYWEPQRRLAAVAHNIPGPTAGRANTRALYPVHRNWVCHSQPNSSSHVECNPPSTSPSFLAIDSFKSRGFGTCRFEDEILKFGHTSHLFVHRVRPIPRIEICYPIIGSSALFMGKITETIPALMKLFEDYGPTVKLWLGPRLFVLVRDPEDARSVLGVQKVQNRDYSMTKAMAAFIGNALFTLRGDTWKVHRKMIGPMFHAKKLESFVEVFGRKSQILVNKLAEYEERCFDVYNVLTLCTLDTICETVIGTSVNSQAEGHSLFLDCIHTMSQYVHRRVVRPWLWPDFIYALSSDGRNGRPLIKITQDFSETVIAQKLAEYRRGLRSPSITTASNTRIGSMLDMMIEASETEGSILSAVDMRDEVTTMAVAGLETTATVMSFLLVLVAMHPEVQAEIHREVDQVLGSDDRPATPEDLQRLPVLERSIKETMRLFPTAPLLVREIDADLSLPSGHTLPANTTAVVLAYALHRDARNFSKPNEFCPDRWLPENMKDLHPFAYLPFGAGPRNCVGQKYANLQMKSVVSNILRSYRVTTPLKMEDLQNLELSVSLCLDQQLGELYRIKLHKR